MASSASELHASAKHRREDGDRAWQLAHDECATAQRELDLLSTAIASAKDRLREYDHDLRQLMADGKSDAERKSDLRAAALDHEGARVQHEEVEARLTQFGVDPSERWSHVAAALDAIRLLYATTSKVKEELLSTVAAPIEKTTTELWTQVCGTQFADIWLDSNFIPRGVTPAVLGNSDIEVPMERLSGGEKEQVFLCTRLAVGKELARSERQFCLFDDILTFTDDTRLGRVCDLLGGAATELQIIIFTCHPERFVAIPGATLIDLETLVCQTGAATDREVSPNV
jgi:uncharacterized protein YhaN